VQPDAVIPVAYAGFAPDPTAPGFAGVDLHLPFEASLLRGRFFAQAIDLVPSAPGNLTATQGLELTLAALAPPPRCAVVESFVTKNGGFPPRGLVSHRSRRPQPKGLSRRCRADQTGPPAMLLSGASRAARAWRIRRTWRHCGPGWVSRAARAFAALAAQGRMPVMRFTLQ